jgi:hypothetical protein
MITTSKWLAVVAVAFVAGSFIASPDLRAFAANTVFSADIVDGEVKTVDLAGNAVTAAKIKDGEVKAAEIATDAVGAAELQGVTKLQYAKCTPDNTEANKETTAGTHLIVSCTVNGLEFTDQVVATVNGASGCFDMGRVTIYQSDVQVWLRNECTNTAIAGNAYHIDLIIFKK